MKELIAFIIMAITPGQNFGQLLKNTETVEVNGIDMYYEVYGDGEPLLLLHGWTQSSRFWSEYVRTYAEYFEVYAIDLRGHGRTSRVTSDFTIEKSSKDILELLDYLKLKKIRAIGLSYGGLTLLELANSNPEKIESMILIGTSPVYNGGENTKGDSAFSYENLPAEFIEELNEIHHHGENPIKALFDPNLNFKINLSNEKLNTFNFRTMIVQGDRDEIVGVDPAFTLYKNIPNSELWIVPNTGHNAIVSPNLNSFLTISLQFLTRDNNEKTDANKNIRP